MRTASALSILDRSKGFSRLKLARLNDQAKTLLNIECLENDFNYEFKDCNQQSTFLSRLLVRIDKDLERWRMFLLALAIGKRSRAAGANRLLRCDRLSSLVTL